MAEEGTTVAAVPGPPPRLTHEELRRAQVETLEGSRRRYGIAARVLFRLLDVVYGKSLTLRKFKVLELIARVPYMAWEQVAFIAITHVHTRTGMARRIQERVAMARGQQDNEMYHLLILEELIARSGQPQPQIKFFWLPQVIAFVYYQLSWLLFVMNPKWSYCLNADFEDHAEHEYMTMVAEHPDWERVPFDSALLTTSATSTHSRMCFGGSLTTNGYTSLKVRLWRRNPGSADSPHRSSALRQTSDVALRRLLRFAKAWCLS